jgi:hypothetical protein
MFDSTYIMNNPTATAIETVITNPVVPPTMLEKEDASDFEDAVAVDEAGAECNDPEDVALVLIVVDDALFAEPDIDDIDDPETVDE